MHSTFFYAVEMGRASVGRTRRPKCGSDARVRVTDPNRQKRGKITVRLGRPVGIALRVVPGILESYGSDLCYQTDWFIHPLVYNVRKDKKLFCKSPSMTWRK